jgi:ion channel-forming bestrophin family protein
MHLGRRYKLTELLLWTRWETAYIFAWSLFATALLEVLHWHFLSMPAPLLAVVGTAVAIVVAFKNQQCFARVNEALVSWGQIHATSLIWASKLRIAANRLDDAQSSLPLKELTYRHFAWLTALRFLLRERRTWENALEPGNARFLAELSAPESKSTLRDELATYLSEADLQKVMAHHGDKEALILSWQYQAVGDLHGKGLVSDSIFFMLTNALDDLVRLQGATKRIKNYPYARNYYSITVLLVKTFVGIVPFALFPYFRDLGAPTGIEHWTAWLNVPFSLLVGWIFVTLEKVGENSSNPFEGGSNDVPVSSIARRIEIEMRTMLGETTDLKPLETKRSILF